MTMTMMTTYAGSVLAALSMGSAAVAQGGGGGESPVFVEFSTTSGDMVIALDREHAPITTEAILQMVENDYYDGLIFHRVVNRPGQGGISVIQGGAFTPELAIREPEMRGGIENEWRNGLMHERGTVAMARKFGEIHSATTQFFVNVTDNPSLNTPQEDNGGYAVFGYVVEGMDVADEIVAVPTEVRTTEEFNLRLRDVPAEDIVIENVVVLEGDEITDEMRSSAEAWSERASAMSASFDERMQEWLVQQARRDCMREWNGRRARETQQAFAERINEVRAEFDDAVSRLADATPDSSGVKTVMLAEGDGEEIDANDIPRLNLIGWVEETGNPIEPASPRGYTEIARAVLPSRLQAAGLVEALIGMRVGSRALIQLPPDLAFGAAGQPQLGVPENADVIYEVEVVEVLPTFEEMQRRLESGAQTTASGIEFVVLEEGEGETAANQDNVTTTYAGFLTNGNVFDSSTFEFSPERVIPGWTEMLTDMRPGERRVVLIPSDLGYGPRGAGDRIPPNSDLIFYIDVHTVDRLDEFIANECDALDRRRERFEQIPEPPNRTRATRRENLPGR